MVAAYACLLAWRLSYYGAIVPNTYFAKRATLAADIGAGVAYVTDWVAGGAGAVVAVAYLIVALALGWRILRSWPFVLLGVHAAAVVTTGGDHFPFGRFFVPLAPLAAVLAGLAVMLIPALLSRPPGAPGVPGPPAVALQGVAMLAAVAALAVPGLRSAREADAVYARYTGKWVYLGQVLKHSLPPGTSIALSPVGAIPYFSGLRTIDILGLTDAHVSHVGADPAIARKGHQKHDGAYILSRKPDVFVLGNGVIVSRDGARPGELWWWPNAGFGPGGGLVRGGRFDWRREGLSLNYEADIEANPGVEIPSVQAGAAAAPGRPRSHGVAARRRGPDAAGDHLRRELGPPGASMP